MSRQGLLDALHDIQLWGIVGQSMVPSLGKIRCGSNDEFLEAYRALEGEVKRLISENEKLRESLAETEHSESRAWGRVRKVEAENDKLWERVYELEELTDHRRYIPQEWYATLQVENAKLRELVCRYAEYASQDRCEGCAVKPRCNDGKVDECWQLTEIRALAREMGIEVH